MILEILQNSRENTCATANLFNKAAGSFLTKLQTLAQVLSYEFMQKIAFHVETSYSICIESQITGLHMKYNTWLKWVNKLRKKSKGFGLTFVLNGSKLFV